MMPFMTGNITTTVMQDIQDDEGNSVVVQVFNDGISVRCGDTEWKRRIGDLIPEVRNAHETVHSQNFGGGRRVPRGEMR